MSSWLKLAGLLLMVAGSACAVNETRVFKMGLLTPWHLGYDFSGYTSASAVSIAMDKVHSDPELNANGRIKLRYRRGRVENQSMRKPFDVHCFCHMGTAIKHPVPDRIKKASFVILAYGHSEAQD